MIEMILRRLSRSVLAASVALALLGPAAARADITAEGDVFPSEFGEIPPAGGIVTANMGTVEVGGTLNPMATTNVGRLIIDTPSFTEPLKSVNGFIGLNAGGVGLVTVAGMFSEWQIDETLSVGVNGQGFFDITGGAEVTSDFLETATDPDAIVGELAGSQGFMMITGAGSKWRHTELIVGHQGYGEIRLLDRAKLETLGPAVIGDEVDITGSDNALGTGYVDLTGLGTRWDVGEELAVAVQGRGELKIRNGALVRVVKEILIGEQANNDDVDSRGVVTVSDQSSELWTLETLTIGSALNPEAQAELYLRDGGRVRADEGITVGFGDLIEMSGETLRSTLWAPTLANAGAIRGSGRIEVTALTNTGDIRNTTLGLGLRERLYVAGTVDNQQNIESLGGEMEFRGMVTNAAAGGEIIARKAVMRFHDGLTNNGKLELDDSIVWLPETSPLVSSGTITIRPSDTSYIMGDLSLGGGSLIEMSIGDDFSHLNVSGDATLGGNINFTLQPGYTPSSGDSFEIITADNVSGAFSSFSMTNPPGLTFALDYVGSSVFLEFGAALPPLNADINGDGIVDGADLAIMNMNFGLMPATMAQGDANGDGVVDGTDQLIWQRQLGTMPVAAPIAGPVATPAAGAVPEPSGVALAGLALAGLMGLRKRGRRAFGRR